MASAIITVISFDYINHRGELRRRHVRPVSIRFNADPGYGYAPGWFLTGFDIQKEEIRDFALLNIVPGTDENKKIFDLGLHAAIVPDVGTTPTPRLDGEEAELG